jgi:hypothetical protein
MQTTFKYDRNTNTLITYRNGVEVNRRYLSYFDIPALLECLKGEYNENDKRSGSKSN